MGTEHSITVKVGNMLGTGEKIKCTGKEFYTTQPNKLLMTENGKMTSYLGMEHCSTRKYPV